MNATVPVTEGSATILGPANQVFYNPEDGLFYERVAEEGIIGTDFRALDPFTYD